MIGDELFEASGWLPAVQPFDLCTSIRFLRGFGACKGDQVLTDESLTKAIAVDGQAVVFELTPSGTGVNYRLWSAAPIGEPVERRVRVAVDGYLSMSDDLSAFYELAAADRPEYARLVRELNGLHHVRFLTVAEIGIWAVLTQRTPRNVATALKRRIAQQLGRALTVGGVDYQAFPELTDLARLSVEDWFALARKERKADYLHALIAGLLDIGEDYLREAPYDDATTALRRIRGVGEFTASAILLRGLGRMDFVPLDMPAFADATAQIYGPGNHTAELRSRYGPYLGYWAYYLRTGLGAEVLAD